MKKLLIVVTMFIFVTNVNAWEWQSIKEDMLYEELIKTIGVPNDVGSYEEGRYGMETVEAIYNNVSGYSATVTFFRSGKKPVWKVSALMLVPKYKVVHKSEINQRFGMPIKVGRHKFLGLKEVFTGGAIVKYSFKENGTVTSIRFGYVDE